MSEWISCLRRRGNSRTFGKAISDNPGWRGGGQGLSSAGAQNILNLKAEKGRADLDHKQRFTVASVFELPFAKNTHGFVKQLLDGWATDGIIQLQSGLPMTPQFSGDVAQMGTNQALRPDLVCNPNLARGEQTIDRFFNTSCLVQQNPFRYGTSGRAVITGPGTISIDLAARKNFVFSSSLSRNAVELVRSSSALIAAATIGGATVLEKR